MPRKSMTSIEAEAKAQWLASLDAPAWGEAAKAMSTITAEAAQFQALTEDCSKGDAKACDTISKEDEAKAAWLAKLDVPEWGKAAKAVEQVAVDFIAVPTISESEAKAAWLAKLDKPAWTSRPKMSEAAAKKAWLDKLDAPTWGAAAEAMTSVFAEASKLAALVADSTQDSNAADGLSKEEEAKQAWLAKLLEVPSWQGKVAPTGAHKAVEEPAGSLFP